MEEKARPCAIEYRVKNLPGAAATRYGNWCVWKDYTSCDLAQNAVYDLRVRYDFYVFRLRTNEGVVKE